jgi:hypothetical protein
MRNEYRTRQVKAEVAQIENEIAAAEAKKKWNADRPAREAFAQQSEHELRELKKRLLLDPTESQDFVYTKYDGRFPDAAAVEKAIRESWRTFLGNHDLDKQAQNTVTMFLQLHPDADISLPETFEAALFYLESRLCPPAETTEPHAPVSVPAPAIDRYDSVRQEIADLRAKAQKCAFASKERDDLERRAYQLETKLEVLGNDGRQSLLQEIVDATGLELSSENAMRFLTWLDGPMQRRRFDDSRTSVRLAFCEYFNNQSFLTADEKELIGLNRSIEALDSEAVKRMVGSRNDYGTRVHSGIRQGGH